MKIEKNSVVSMHYRLTDAGGRLLDSSEGRAPLVYLHGAGNIIEGLEKALEGKSKGDHVQDIVIAPAEAYGERDESLQRQVMRSKFPKTSQIQVGMSFHAATPEGGTGVVRVVKVEGDVITVDANHPLAGVELHFDVTLEDIRPATEEEIEHGHAHGPGGHHHH